MIQRKRSRLSPTEKEDIWRRWKCGQSLHEIGRAHGRPHPTIRKLLLPSGGIPPITRRRSRLALLLWFAMLMGPAGLIALVIVAFGFATRVIDYEPFKSISDMTYFGPSMAERTAVLGGFIASHPDATYAPAVRNAEPMLMTRDAEA